MSKEQLDRIEEHVAQLIEMVAGNNKSVNRLEQRFDGLEQRFESEKKLNQLRHEQLLEEIRHQSFDIDYLRDKVSKHDMKIHKIIQTQIAESKSFE